MAQRRMFSLKVVDTDEFLDMGQGSQLLYFHLAMRADDDGFVNCPKKILRFAGAKDDDFKVLVAKQFIIPFQNGVIVIRHWKENNYIQSDRKQKTIYQEELAKLSEDNNGVYNLDTECIQNVSNLDTQVRIGKDRIGKDRIGKNNCENKIFAGSDINKILDIFYKINPNIKFNNLTERKATEQLIQIIGDTEQTISVLNWYFSVYTEEFCPIATTPAMFLRKISQIKLFAQKKRQNNINTENKFIQL